jgi:hypothetical protein
MGLCDENVDLNKPRLELTATTGLRESDCCGVQLSQRGHFHFGHLTRLASLFQRSQAVLGASAHSEMRRARIDAECARENNLASIQLARQRAK